MARVEDLAERLAAKMRWRLTPARAPASARPAARSPAHDPPQTSPHGGTPIELAFRRRRDKPVKLVLLVDVSGSMSVYATFFLRFVRTLSDRFRHAEPFVLPHAAGPDRPGDAGEEAFKKALDRIEPDRPGLLRRHPDRRKPRPPSTGTMRERVLDSRSVAIIVSDGYDTGEPERLGAEMARLKRRARRVVWLNPMIGWEGYEPVARGMQAALPHVDLFAPAHNLESVAALEPWLARL